MYLKEYTIIRGVKILWEGMIEEFAVMLDYDGIDGDWNEAEDRGLGIGDEAIQYWLNKKAMAGNIEYISPLDIKFYDSDNVMAIVKENINRIKPKTIKNEIKSLASKMIPLTFDASGSEERCWRILRANEEKMTFIHQANGDWSCLTAKGSIYRVSVDLEKSMGYCTCDDFQKRGLVKAMPCKHIYAYITNTETVKKARLEDRLELIRR